MFAHVLWLPYLFMMARTFPLYFLQAARRLFLLQGLQVIAGGEERGAPQSAQNRGRRGEKVVHQKSRVARRLRDRVVDAAGHDWQAEPLLAYQRTARTAGLPGRIKENLRVLTLSSAQNNIDGQKPVHPFSGLGARAAALRLRRMWQLSVLIE